jgi:hypothetical protein
MPERGCVVLDQPQPLGIFQRFCVFNLLRLVFDTAALHFQNTLSVYDKVFDEVQSVSSVGPAELPSPEHHRSSPRQHHLSANPRVPIHIQHLKL